MPYLALWCKGLCRRCGKDVIELSQKWHGETQPCIMCLDTLEPMQNKDQSICVGLPMIS